MQKAVEPPKARKPLPGLDNLVLLKRRCFGLDDPVELFRRLWLDIKGSRLWA